MIGFIDNILYNKDAHPDEVIISRLAKKYPKAILKFYTYNKPGRYTPAHAKFLSYMPMGEKNKYKKLKKHLSSGDSLALEPRVLIGEDTFYIPMIDFKDEPTYWNFEHLARLVVLDLPQLEGETLYVFNSGNSYHGYIPTLLNSGQWEEWKSYISQYSFVDQVWCNLTCKGLRWSTGVRYGQHVPQLHSMFRIGK